MWRCLATIALLLATPAVADQYIPPALTTGTGVLTALGLPVNGAGGLVTLASVTADGYMSNGASMTNGGNLVTDSGRSCAVSDIGKLAVVAAAGTLGTIAVPVAPSITQYSNGALAGTTYFAKTTYVTSLDGTTQETTPSAETSFVASVNNTIYVAAPPPISGAVGWNVYIGNTASGGTGTETKQNILQPLTTNGVTAAGNPTLHFASVPATIIPGMVITDTTTPSAVTATSVVISTTATTVVMSANAAGAGVGGTDVMNFGFPNAAGTMWLPFHKAYYEQAGGLTTTGAAVPGANTTSYAPPLVTTIAACSGTKFQLTASQGSGGSLAADQWAFGTDNCASTFVTSQLGAVNRTFLIPNGKALFGNCSLPLDQVSLAGQNVSRLVNDATYTAAGSMWLFSSPTAVPFSIQRGVTIAGMNFYWPGQWKTYPGPVAYPPLFTDDGTDEINNWTLRDDGIIAAFDMFSQSPANLVGAIGGTTLTVANITNGAICLGGPVNGSGVTASTTITGLPNGQTSGCTIAAGAYTVNNSQTVASEALTTGTPTINKITWDNLTPYCIDVCILEQKIGQAIQISNTDFNNNVDSFINTGGGGNNYIYKWGALNSWWYIGLGSGAPGGSAGPDYGQLRLSNDAWHSSAGVFNLQGYNFTETSISGSGSGNTGTFLFADQGSVVKNLRISNQTVQVNQIVNGYDNNLGPLFDYESKSTTKGSIQIDNAILVADGGLGGVFRLNSSNMTFPTISNSNFTYCINALCSAAQVAFVNDTAADFVFTDNSIQATRSGANINGIVAVNANQGSITGTQFNGQFYALDYSSFVASQTALAFCGNTTQSTGGTTPINLGTTRGKYVVFGGGTCGNAFDKTQPTSITFNAAQTNTEINTIPWLSPAYSQIRFSGVGPGGSGGAGVVAANPSGGGGGGGGAPGDRTFNLSDLIDATDSNNHLYINGGAGGVAVASSAGGSGTDAVFSKNSAGAAAFGNYTGTADITHAIITFGAGGGGAVGASAANSIGGAGGSLLNDGGVGSASGATGCGTAGIGGNGSVGGDGQVCGAGGGGGVIAAAAGKGGGNSFAGAGGGSGGGYNGTAEAGGTGGKSANCFSQPSGGTAGNGANGGTPSGPTCFLSALSGNGGAGGGGADGTHTGGGGAAGVFGGGGGGGGSALTGGTLGNGANGGAASIRVMLQ